MHEHPFNPYHSPKPDSSSSIYSRSTRSVASVEVELPSNLPRHRRTNNNSISSDSPEINRMDHAIQSAQGSTIALETMRSRLQASKSHKVQSRDERLSELEEELAWHQQENEFYGICYDGYRGLHSKVADVSQKLLLQSFFEPESRPSRDPFLYDVIQRLNTAVKMTQVQEAQAEADWKRFWHITDDCGVRATWI
ncbi:uncharacterized protein BDW43DRAFT_316386 [Aspergillus alliaceus]|uniref:uncharacterized protein n=1 Tax=Petromyces alliaceus TaxID=209559 RepID=UPI0012A65FFC|nr:uncharacterized protein BDW43DRAFT_316386 [Aspergillus alliaceus]KAB8227876.1 hypothetical protein BDW43DRAFT_316386 [Aspergillus alliaceus]